VLRFLFFAENGVCQIVPLTGDHTYSWVCPIVSYVPGTEGRRGLVIMCLTLDPNIVGSTRVMDQLACDLGQVTFTSIASSFEMSR
jgi:hypothetical protein